MSLSFGWLLLLTGCQHDLIVRKNVNNEHQGTGTQIIAFGDSLTVAAGVATQAAYPAANCSTAISY